MRFTSVLHEQSYSFDFSGPLRWRWARTQWIANSASYAFTAICKTLRCAWQSSDVVDRYLTLWRITRISFLVFFATASEPSSVASLRNGPRRHCLSVCFAVLIDFTLMAELRSQPGVFELLQMFRGKMGSWRKAFKSRIEFVFIDAPHVVWS